MANQNPSNPGSGNAANGGTSPDRGTEKPMQGDKSQGQSGQSGQSGDKGGMSGTERERGSVSEPGKQPDKAQGDGLKGTTGK